MKYEITEEEKKYRYYVKKGSVKAINEFKNFIGEEQFGAIEQGIPVIDIPLDEEQYRRLLSVILENDPEHPEDLADIPYGHAEELIGFFCEPFSGRLLKRTESMLNGISSMLRKLTPEQIETLTRYIPSPNPNEADIKSTSFPEGE